MNTTEYFNKYQNMIEKKVYEVSRTYFLDLEDVRSDAYLAFCKAIKSYDPEKTSFCTHLHHRLSALSIVAQRRYEKRRKYYSTFDAESVLENTGINQCFEKECIESEALESLGEEEKKVVDYLLSYEWIEKTNGSRPTKDVILDHFSTEGWNHHKFSCIWKNIKNWWNEEEHKYDFNLEVIDYAS